MLSLPVVLAAALAAGIALALAHAFSPSMPFALLALLMGVAAVALAARAPRALLAAAVAGVVAAGAALGAHAEARARQPALSGGVVAGKVSTLRGLLTEDASLGANGVRLRLAVHSVDGRAYDGGEVAALTVAGVLAVPQIREWTAGRTIEVPASIRRPAHYRNPGVTDDRHALARRGLVVVGSVKSGGLVEVVARAGWREERAAALRARVRGVMERYVAVHDPTASAVATAILIGDRAGLDADLEDRLQAAGTYHVIAISGGNIAVLAVAMLGLARLIRLPPRSSHLLVALLLVAHADLVGAAPSVVRATAMAVVYLGLRCVDQSAWSLNALAAAAAGLLVVSPLALVDPGFLLSVGATAALIVLAGRLASFVRGPRLWQLAAGIVAASLATEIVLLPISATFFNRVTAAGLVLNLGAVPLMAVVQVAGSITTLADAVAPPFARVAGLVTSRAAEGLVGSAWLVEWWPWLALRTPAPERLVTALYLGSVLVMLVAPSTLPRGAARRGVVRCAAGMALLTAAWTLTAPQTWRWPWRADGLLRLVALDVGQGDATLVEFPDGTRWLVDAGGLPGSSSYDLGARVVAPALWTRGIGRLDRLILTHGDPDHVGGADSVIDDFRPAIAEGVPVPSHPTLARLHQHAATRRRPWARVSAGDTWAIGGVTVRVWHPAPPDWERQRVRNDDSIVVELRFGDVSMVLPGDISAAVERTLAADIPPARVRVLKLAHHGSATSTSAEWLDALRPRVAIVSCGRDNRYRHPAPAVMARLKERGIAVRRTDLEGMVVVETDGTTIRNGR